MARYNTIFGDEINALSTANPVPVDLSAVTETNGDIYLRFGNGDEVEFTVIGVICGECLVAPMGFAR